MPVAVAEKLKIVPACTHHPIAFVGITQGNRQCPLHLGVGANILIGLPANIIGRRPYTKNRVEQQVEAAGTGTHNQVDTGHCIGKAFLGLVANMLNANRTKILTVIAIRVRTTEPLRLRKLLVPA